MGNKQTILIIDNDYNSNQYISQLLLDNNYIPYSTVSGTEGLTMITSICPDMIILNSKLPDKSVTKLIYDTRNWSNIPIIIISDENNISNMVKLLDIGANDYISKPFCDKELLARIRTAFRCHHFPYKENKYIHENLMISFDNQLVILDNQIIHLTNTEYKILSYLAKHNGKTVTYADLMAHVWGPYVDDDTRILRVNVTHIRKKLESDKSKPLHIITEPGIGYRMHPYNN